MKTKLLLITACTIAAGSLSSCVTGGPGKSGLELQAFQKQSFTASKKVAFASTMSVFQDLGYVIKSASFETGLITASSPTKNLVLFGSHMSNTDASAFVEEISGTNTSIRLNFVNVNESSSGYGMKTRSDLPIQEAEPYQNAFSKIREAIFVRAKFR